MLRRFVANFPAAFSGSPVGYRLDGGTRTTAGVVEAVAGISDALAVLEDARGRAEASAMAQGCLVQCACKRMYGPDDATWPREERPSHVALAAPMVRELARAVADVAEVRRWERAELARYAGGGPAPPSCPDSTSTAQRRPSGTASSGRARQCRCR